METWQKNLLICCVASFIVSIGMSQMGPILPLYIEELGVTDPGDVARWSGIVFGCNFVSLAIASPIWGRLSDRYHKKPMMLRATGWLGLIMIGMGFAQSVWHLVALRLMQGALSGFQSATIPLIASETPKNRSGWALSIFFAAQVSGGLLGPLVGGALSEVIGYRHSFLFIGSCCLAGFLLVTQVHETREPSPQAAGLSLRETFARIPRSGALVGLFLTTLLLHFSISCVQPILTVYIRELDPDTAHLALVSGAVFSSAGIASVLFASRLGKLSDRIGSAKVLLGSLTVAGLVSIPQGLVTSAAQLAVLRFIHGAATAGFMPSTNNLIRELTPAESLGRIYGFNQSAQFVGMFTGSFLGGQLTASIGFSHTFFLVAALLLLDALWCRRVICAPAGK